MIQLNGRVTKVEAGRCLITIPNDTSMSDVIQVYSDTLTQGQPVRVTIEPMKVRAAGIGSLVPSMIG